VCGKEGAPLLGGGGAPTTSMKIYAAAVYTNNLELTGQTFKRLTPREKEARQAVRYILESYHYVSKQSYVDKMRRDGVKVFLDSGAFSAYMLGASIDIDGYIAYIKANADIIEIASVLDGIGDPQKTFDNQTYMERHGVRPMPCFHYGEDPKWLLHYIKNYDYISLGGMVPIAKPQLVQWLDRIWNDYLCDANGRARIKVHGFGLTKLDLMWRYPWFSVDSTSWLMAGNNGLLILPPDARKFPVSNDSPARRKPGAHFNTISEAEQWKVWATVTSRGFDFFRCQEIYLARWCFNLAAMDEINTKLQEQSAAANTFVNPQLGIFNNA
jgi:hypothetical protein